MSNANEPAYPARLKRPDRDYGTAEALYPGMTKREHAAILLRVPKSGNDEIDAMIRAANRRDAAKMAMYGYIAQHLRNFSDIANESIDAADALLAKLELRA